MDSKFRTFISRLENFLSAEIAGKNAQDRLDDYFVNLSIPKYTKESLSVYCEQLIKSGRVADVDEAFHFIANKNLKGNAFEGLLNSRHSGQSPFNSVNQSLSMNDPQIDNELILNDVFGRSKRVFLQAKSSTATAIEAVKSGKYRNPIIVPKNIFEELKNKKDPEILAAVNSGKLISKAGNSGEIELSESIEQAKRRLKQIYNESPQENFYKTVVLEVGKAATIGAAFRGGVTAAKILIVEKKIDQKNLKVIGKEALNGGLETGLRVGLARGIEKTIVRNGAKPFGRWVGRTAGAGTSLVVSTFKDVYLLGTGKIDGNEFGLRCTKNTVIAIATTISGPLGLAASLTISAGEVIYSENKINNKITSRANMDSEMYDSSSLEKLSEVKDGLNNILKSDKQTRDLILKLKKSSRNL